MSLFIANGDPACLHSPPSSPYTTGHYGYSFVVPQRDTQQERLMLPPEHTWDPHHSLCYCPAQRSKSSLVDQGDKQKPLPMGRKVVPGGIG